MKIIRLGKVKNQEQNCTFSFNTRGVFFLLPALVAEVVEKLWNRNSTETIIQTSWCTVSFQPFFSLPTPGLNFPFIGPQPHHHSVQTPFQEIHPNQVLRINSRVTVTLFQISRNLSQQFHIYVKQYNPKHKHHEAKK